jgi:hypothetical protein
MIHRKQETYIQFILFGDEKEVFRRSPYAKTVCEGFSTGGKPMLTPCNARVINAAAATTGTHFGV